RENEKIGIDVGADRVHAKILGAGVAAAGAVKPGHRVRAAFCERLAQHVAWPGARPAAPAGIGTGSIGHALTSFELPSQKLVRPLHHASHGPLPRPTGEEPLYYFHAFSTGSQPRLLPCSAGE